MSMWNTSKKTKKPPSLLHKMQRITPLQNATIINNGSEKYIHNDHQMKVTTQMQRFKNIIASKVDFKEMRAFLDNLKKLCQRERTTSRTKLSTNRSLLKSTHSRQFLSSKITVQWKAYQSDTAANTEKRKRKQEQKIKLKNQKGLHLVMKSLTRKIIEIRKTKTNQ